MLELQTRAPIFDRVLFSSRKGYLVPRRDGRMIAGSTMEFAGLREGRHRGRAVTQILEMALETVPGPR